MIRIPLTLYKVEYTCSEDRKFEEVDFLILQAIKNKIGNLDKLEKFFFLPKRMLMEVVVGLIEYGYVGLASMKQGGFIATLSGKHIDSIEMMSETAEIEPRYMFILRENITGMLIKRNEKLRYESDKDIENKESVLPVKTSPPHTLPYANVRPLIQGELHQIKHLHQISGITKIMSGIHVNISYDSFGNLELPELWCNSSLERILIENSPCGIQKPESVTPDELTQPPLKLKKFRPDQDILWTKEEHADCLSDAFDRAHSHLLVVSAHAKSATIKNLSDKLNDAVKRGVHLDLVIGIQETEEEGGIDKLVNELNNKIKYHSYPGSIALHKSGMPSDVKLLLYDIKSEGYQAITGSYNWLYEPVILSSSAKKMQDISVRLYDSQAVSDIAMTITGWCSDLSPRWQEIIRKGIEPSTPVAGQEETAEEISYRLIYDQENAYKFEDMQYSAKKRLLVCSHKIGLATIGSNNADNRGRIRYLDDKPDEFELYFYYDQVTDSSVWGEEQEKSLRKRLSGKSTIKKKEGSHARIVVSDDSVLLSSFNFLSAGTRSNKHIGIQFYNSDIADRFWEKII